MPFEISYDEKDGIVLARVFGMATHDEHLCAQEEAFKLCNEHKSSGILVDLRDLDTKKSSITNCFKSGEFIALMSRPRMIRIAHVLPTDSDSERKVHFTATIAKNLGQDTEEFSTIEEAKQWLEVNE